MPKTKAQIERELADLTDRHEALQRAVKDTWDELEGDACEDARATVESNFADTDTHIGKSKNFLTLALIDPQDRLASDLWREIRNDTRLGSALANLGLELIDRSNNLASYNFSQDNAGYAGNIVTIMTADGDEA